MKTLRLLIADDEAPGRQAARDAVAACGAVEIAGEAVNGLEVLERVAELSPDVVLLDIEMPGLNGLEVAANLPGHVRIVFVTAFDRYAVSAFETNALDYVLKPYSKERIRRALDRVRADLQRDDSPYLEHLRHLLREARERPLRLAVRRQKRILLVSPPEILYATVEDKLTFVVTAEDRFLCERTLAELESLLECRGFFRISRSVLVNLDSVQELVPWFSGTWRVHLKTGEELEVSRERGKRLKRHIG